MIRKQNPFERIKQTRIVDEDNDIDWWVDDEDLDNYADWYEDDPDVLKEKREISAHEWNKHLIGSIYDDHQGVYLDEDCPLCAHLLVHPSQVGDLIGNDEVPLAMKHCSNWECKYATHEFLEEQIRSDEAEKGPKKEWTKLRLVDETIAEFCHRNKVSLFSRNGDYVMDECVVCKKKPLEASDWYQTKDYAVVEFQHDGCDNGPCTMVPLGDKAKMWAGLLGGFFPDKN